MRDRLLKLWQEEDAQDLTEYALLTMMVALAAVAAINSLGFGLSIKFRHVALYL